jgi:hypothetical protein
MLGKVRCRRQVVLAISVGVLAASLSAQEWQWRWLPYGLRGRQTVWDAARGRVVLFGAGIDVRDGPRNLTWEFDGAHWTPVATVTAPFPNSGYGLVYDAGRARTVLFSGAETWEYVNGAWNRVLVTGPSLRTSPAFVYDAARQRCVLFGGLVGSIGFTDTWEYNGVQWQQIATATTPSPIAQPVAAYDALRQRTVLVAIGAGTWEYDGVDWTAIANAATPQQSIVPAYAAWHPGLQRTVLVSGDNTTLQLRTWTYDGVQWAALPTATPPSRDISSSLAYDPVRQRLVMAGEQQNANPDRPTTVEFDGQAWRDVGDLPRFLDPETLVADPAHGRLLAVAGATSTFIPSMLAWEYDGTRWSSTTAAGLFLVGFGAMGACWDAPRERMLVLALPFGSGAMQTCLYANGAWTVTGPSGPSRRSGFRISCDRARARCVLFGGARGLALLQDTWEYDGNAWATIATGNAPSPRSSHAMTWDPAGGRTVLFGGANSLTASGTPATWVGGTWAYDGNDWQQLQPGVEPSPRGSAGCTADELRGGVVLFGGRDGNGLRNDLWCFDGAAWQPMSAGNTPSPRSGALVWSPATDRLVALAAPAYAGGFEYPGAEVTELVPAAVATFAHYGTGCAGSSGVPTLDRVGNAVPSLGSTFVLQLGTLPATPGAAVLGFGFDRVHSNGQPLPTGLALLGMPECLLWLDPVPSANVLLAQPAVTQFALHIPAAASLAGIVVAAQALVFDATAPNGNGAVTNGVVMGIQ